MPYEFAPGGLPPTEEAFFQAWRNAALIAGERYFGDGTAGCADRAQNKNDLRPNAQIISDAIEYMSPGERDFLAAMISFFNPRSEARAAFGLRAPESLGHLAARCDLKRRAALASLIASYVGW